MIKGLRLSSIWSEDLNNLLPFYIAINLDKAENQIESGFCIFNPGDTVLVECFQISGMEIFG